MSDNSPTLLVTFDDEDTAKRFNADLMALNARGQVLSRQNLDGNAATWIVVATTAITAMPKILDSLAKVIEALKVRSIRIGDKEIRNPSTADVRAMRKEWEKPPGK